MKLRRRLLFLALLLLLAAGSAMAAYNEPAYTVVEQHPLYEVREYAPHIVAEVTTQGSYGASSSTAFRVLAKYIFGGNKSRDGSGSRPMSMTIPVTATPKNETETQHVWTFFMEPQYTLETLPTPNDSRVSLVEVPARRVAVKRYSGRTTESNFHEARAVLAGALRADGVDASGEATNAVYNGPWTPPFLRRNEVLQPLGSSK